MAAAMHSEVTGPVDKPRISVTEAGPVTAEVAGSEAVVVVAFTAEAAAGEVEGVVVAGE